MAGWTSTGRAGAPCRRPRAARPSRGRGRPCPARRRSEDLAAGGRRAQAIELALGHRARDLSSGSGGRRVALAARARPHLPRLPARRDRLERLQRRARPRRSCAPATRCTCSARTATRSRSTGSTPRATGTAGALARRARAASRSRATVYRPDIGGLLPRLRRRPLRGHRGAAVPRAHRGRARRATSTRNVAAVREVAERVAAGRRAGQPPRDGPG